MAPPNAPYVRPLYGPKHPKHVTPGRDVIAVKRALSRADYMPWREFSEDYNAAAVTAVKKFQRDHKIDASGNYGIATHGALLKTRSKEHPGEWAFDATAARLLRQAKTAHTATPEQEIQHRGVDAANYWILHRDESVYAQVRPFPLLKPPKIARYTDCSGFVTEVYYAAGAPDPNGREYDGQGYTGTLVGQGWKVDVGDIDLLDLVFFGFTTRPSSAFPYGSPTHVATYIGGGYIATNGSNSGPEKRTVNYRSDFHSVRRYPLR